MDYLISEQRREVATNEEDVLMSDEMLFALIADIVLAGIILEITLKVSPCCNIVNT